MHLRITHLHPYINRLRLCEHLASCEACRPCTLTCHGQVGNQVPKCHFFFAQRCAVLSDARSAPAVPHLSLSKTGGTRGQVLLPIDPQARLPCPCFAQSHDGMVAAQRRLDATQFCIQCSTCPVSPARLHPSCEHICGCIHNPNARMRAAPHAPTLPWIFPTRPRSREI